jgi:hypothetical protein
MDNSIILDNQNVIKGAGIIIYKYDKGDGKIYFLMKKEIFQNEEVFSDIGSELLQPNKTIEYTAVCAANNETNGLLHRSCLFWRIKKNPGSFGIYLNESEYIVYFTPATYFENNLESSNFPIKEIEGGYSSFEWVQIEHMIKLYFLFHRRLQTNIFINAINDIFLKNPIY